MITVNGDTVVVQGDFETVANEVSNLLLTIHGNLVKQGFDKDFIQDMYDFVSDEETQEQHKEMFPEVWSNIVQADDTGLGTSIPGANKLVNASGQPLVLDDVPELSDEAAKQLFGGSNPNADIDKLYEVWSEGYHVNEGRQGAKLMGKVKASSFQEACDKVMSSTSEPHYYNKEDLTYWGCKLFDNEQDARKSFG